MPQPIAGVVPPEIDEAPAMTVWPTIGAAPRGPLGRPAGRDASRDRPVDAGGTAGRGHDSRQPRRVRLAVHALRVRAVHAHQPAADRRPRPPAVDEEWIGLEDFDAVEVEVLPGQQWLHCGKVVFQRGGKEVLRLSGVSRPEVFRQVCFEARNAVLSVRGVLDRRTAGAGA